MIHPLDSSTSATASSPFSTRSTSASSPEVFEQKPQIPGASAGTTRQGYARGADGFAQNMQAMLGSFANGGYPSYPTNFPPPSPLDVKPTLPLGYAPQHPASAAPSAPASEQGGIGGMRSEPPKRQLDIDELPLVQIPLDRLAGDVKNNVLLLQGDPQSITKQRVETAIRVILDLLHLRSIPPSPLPPSTPPHLTPFLARDTTTGHFLQTLERISTFRALRLQAGTTTKASSKKQLQAGPTPVDHLAYLETAVYMSEPEGKRVYVCKRCRMRETRRRQSKDASRKKPNNTSHSGSESSAAPTATLPAGHPTKRPPRARIMVPSAEYITGDNPDQYDPHKSEQVVEEPEWDPDTRDWRHEIVLFNSPPEVLVKDGSCVWLPFRVVCYGKCHGEKVGFRIKFTIRTYDGREICSAITHPIRITDDHKTDSKSKPKVEGMSSTNPAVSRGRRARGSTAATASAASSRRQSPAPSEVESVQSVSEAGAVTQKQTPQVRQGKPYERPTSLSPLNGPISMDAFQNTNANLASMEMPPFRRQNSGNSIHSVASMSSIPVQTGMVDRMTQGGISNEFPMFDQPKQNGTVSPGALRRAPFSAFTQLDGTRAQHRSTAPSASSSNVASPNGALRPLDDTLLQQENPLSPATQLMSALNFSFGNNGNGQAQAPMLWGGQANESPDVDMSNPVPIPSDLNALNFDTSSVASSFDSHSLSQWRDSSSAFYSESGVVPEQLDDGMNFLDFSGGEDQQSSGLNQPYFPSNQLSPRAQLQDEQINEMLSVLSQTQASPVTLPPIDPSTIPVISNVIPADGPMAGGTKVVVLGERFSQGVTVMFGERIARLETVTPSYIECVSPPSTGPGVVEVCIQGIPGGTAGGKRSWFKYNVMDSDLMMLALQVKDQYQGSSSDAAYRLAQHVAARSNSQSASEYNSSPSTGGPSPQDSTEATPSSQTSLSSASSSGSSSSPERPVKADLQKTVIDFVASLDEDSPGALRRSKAINHRNASNQTLLHVATMMGYHRLLRRLVFIGAHLDLQDVNGYTALALASLSGQSQCARVLIEAGAAYDRPTLFGEMPLDLAKVGEHTSVEALLLSAVWSTDPVKEGLEVEAEVGAGGERGAGSGIDDDNPSSGSDGEVSALLQRSKKRRSKAKGKQRAAAPPVATSTSTLEEEERSESAPTITQEPADAPPPYTAPITATAPGPGPSWMSRTLSNISNPPHPPFKIPLPSFLSDLGKVHPAATSEGGAAAAGGWVAFPAPSWDILSKMTSPEEVRLFTQAMAAAAFNAVLQSAGEVGINGMEQWAAASAGMGMGGADEMASSGVGGGPTGTGPDGAAGRRARGHMRIKSSKARSESGSPGEKVVKHVKRDRMLYLFWLPILLFVGFWVVVSALPLATGFCLIYARQITRAIKQRM